MTQILQPSSLASMYLSLSPQEQEAYMASLTPRQLSFMKYDWDIWSRPNQRWENLWRDNSKPFSIFLAGRGFGKAVALDTPILTPVGWKNQGNLQAGDIVFDEHGKQCNVLYVTDPMYNHECYKLTFSDGSEIVADAEHEWFVWDKRARKSYGRSANPTCHPHIKTTKELLKKLYIPRNDSEYEVNYSVPICEPLHMQSQDLLIDPYTLGYWLGNGCTYGAMISCIDKEVCDYISDAGYIVKQWSDPISFGINTGDAGCLLNQLKSLNLINNKHIPDIYLRGSIEQRQQLLYGLMDSDGHCEEKGSVEFMQKNKQIVEGVYFLMASLGLKPVMAEKEGKIYDKSYGTFYRVTCTPHIPAFRLPRKLKCQNIGGKSQAQRNHMRYITSIVPVESVPVCCIKVDSPNSLYLCGKSLIPTHNTRLAVEAVRKAVYHYGYKRLSLVGATATDAKQIMVNGESGILNCFPEEERPVYHPSDNELIFKNGAVAYVFSADNPERFRGKQCDFFWLDELCAWEKMEDSFDQIMFGARLGNPRGIVTTTPRPSELLNKIVKGEYMDLWNLSTGSTYDNIANLAPTFVNSIVKKYEGTRQGEQELHGKILENLSGALWNDSMFQYVPGGLSECLRKCVKIGIAIDPAVSANSTSDETGIIVGGIDADLNVYLFDDKTGIHSTGAWKQIIRDLYDLYEADMVIGEVNNGGDLIKANIHSAGNHDIAFTAVHATRGKEIRATPFSSYYEQGKVFHVKGKMKDTEEEMCSWIPGVSKQSPNRCFVAGTKIMTNIGEKNIEDIKIGDYVLTRQGYNRVTAAGLTNSKADVLTLTLSSGKLITCTKDHPIFVQKRGFLPAWKLSQGSQLEGIESNPLYLTGLSISDTQTTRAKQEADIFPYMIKGCGENTLQCCISRFMKVLMDQFQQVATFTTMTKTLLTTILPTLCALLTKNMDNDTQVTISKKSELSCPTPGNMRISGTEATRVSSGIKNTGKNVGKVEKNPIHWFVNNVVNNMIHSSPHTGRLIFVQQHVLIDTMTPLNGTQSRETVNIATPNFLSSLGISKEPVPLHVVRSCDAGVSPVYNITVEDNHEYYANGILVHNCDAAVWLWYWLVGKKCNGLHAEALYLT